MALLDWSEEWHTICEWDLPFSRWFVGGKLNVAYNCVDRHVAAGKGDKVAIFWEGEPGDRRVITYGDLLDRGPALGDALKGLGVEQGDRVAIYMPMIPEAVVAMLACARIGAIHTVVFGGFSAEALRGSDQRRPGQGADHGRWRLPPRRSAADEARCGLRPARVPRPLRT